MQKLIKHKWYWEEERTDQLFSDCDAERGAGGHHDTGSGDLTSDLELGLAGKDQYTAGSGAASFEVETASGDLHIC